jgi:hypothetical protein
MYKDKGLIKVFNGRKYKIVSYRNQDGLITFTTSSKSNKYNELTQTRKIKVMEQNGEKIYDMQIIEEKSAVDEIFAALKSSKTIPFFIPRKDKIIVQYRLND